MADALIPKYPTEIFLELQSVDRFLYRVSDLYSLDKHARRDLLARLDQCHLYLLGKRPRLSAVPESLHVTPQNVCLEVEYKLEGAVHRAGVAIPRSLFEPEERVLEISPYPHRGLIGRDENGEVIVETLLANYVNRMPNVADQAKDLEVAYIGKGLRNSAQDRLRHHETLQRLLADLSATEPDSEIFALVYAFKCRKQTLIFPNATTEFTGDAAAKRWARALAYRPSVGEQTALVEACCISYFRPEKYNTHYLDFPTGTYQILGPLHDADFAGLLVQLDNTSIDGQRVYSRIVRPASIHDIVIDFRRLEHRYSFISKP